MLPTVYILFPITLQVLQQASKVHVCELFHVCVAISTSVVLAHFKFPICAETSVSWQSAVLMNLWRPQKRSLSSLSQVSLLGTCFASFGKPFKLKTPKDRTAVSSVLSLSLAHAVKEDKNGFHKHTMRTQPCVAKDIAKPNK